MALPALPANNTSRVFVTYFDSINEHTLSIRFTDFDVAPASVLDRFGEFLIQLGPFLPNNWRVLEASWQAEGSIVQLPLPLSTFLTDFRGTTGTANLAPNDAPRELRWVGRSPTSGRKVSMSLYGFLGVTPATYRFPSAEGTVADPDIFAHLNTTDDVFLAIDGSKPIWYPYVNIQYNSYWETERRG